MRDQKNSVKKTIMSKRAEYGLTRDVPCSEQENKTYSEMLKNGETLPEGVFPYSYTDGTKSDSAFYVLGDEPTDAEISEFLKYKELELLSTIKNCVVFFTVMAIIGIITDPSMPRAGPEKAGSLWLPADFIVCVSTAVPGSPSPMTTDV